MDVQQPKYDSICGSDMGEPVTSLNWARNQSCKQRKPKPSTMMARTTTTSNNSNNNYNNNNNNYKMTKHYGSTRRPTAILPKPFALLLVTALLSFIIASVADAASGGSASSAKLPLPLVAGPRRTTTMVATSARRLDEAAAAVDDADDAAVSNEAFQYDLSQFSLKFDKCQYVKMYDDDVAQDYESSSPLALKHFAVFRLCPTEACTSCDADGVVYGTYAVPVDDYLQYTVENQQRTIENVCKQCDEQDCTDDAAAAAEACDDGANNCNGGGGLSCSACQAGCYQYQNLEDSGYVDASEFLECQKLEVQQAQAADDGNEQQQQAEGEQDQAAGDDEAEQQAEGDAQGRRRVEENADDAQQQQQLYIGARCSSSGKIVIGVFSDERCWEPRDDLDVDTLLGAKLSYHLLNASYAADNGGCQSCLEDKDNENERDAEDADDVNEMCEEVYNAAAKCESETGLDVGFVQMNREEQNYENQVENEFQACTFVNSLIWNSYTETGEINVKAPQDVIVRVVTEKQTIALSLIGSFIVATLGVMFYLDRRIRQIEDSQPLIAKGESTVL